MRERRRPAAPPANERCRRAYHESQTGPRPASPFLHLFFLRMRACIRPKDTGGLRRETQPMLTVTQPDVNRAQWLKPGGPTPLRRATRWLREACRKARQTVERRRPELEKSTRRG